jgi:ABC-type enterobactin transport system permease subunit
MGEEFRFKNKNTAKRFSLAVVVLLCIVVCSFFVGRYYIEPSRLVQLLAAAPSDWLDNPDVSVFYYIRLPRIILAVLVGAALSVAGSLFQGIFRNLPARQEKECSFIIQNVELCLPILLYITNITPIPLCDKGV